MKTKITITAEDKIGRTESINIIVDEEFANKLITYDHPLSIINYHIDRSRYHEYSEFSSDQVRRLVDFFDLIYHKFYKYTLSVERA